MSSATMFWAFDGLLFVRRDETQRVAIVGIVRENDMLFALWLMWVSSGGNGAAKVGEFDTIDACKKAAASAVHVGTVHSSPKYSFLCVQVRSEMKPGGNG